MEGDRDEVRSTDRRWVTKAEFVILVALVGASTLATIWSLINLVPF